MNMTAEKFFVGERERLLERRDAIRAEIQGLNSRLTEARREASLLDDMVDRLDAHLPAVSAPDVLTLKREASA